MKLHELLAPGNKGCAVVKSTYSSLGARISFNGQDAYVENDLGTYGVDSMVSLRTTVGYDVVDYYLEPKSYGDLLALRALGLLGGEAQSPGPKQPCRCDFHSVVMVTGCTCGGV